MVIPTQLTDRAELKPEVLDYEAQEAVALDRDARAHDFFLMAEAATYEAASLRKLLAEWRGKR